MWANTSVMASVVVALGITLAGCATGQSMNAKSMPRDIHGHCGISQSDQVEWYVMEEGPDSEWAFEDFHGGNDNPDATECELYEV